MGEHEDEILTMAARVNALLSPEERAWILAAMRPMLADIAANVAHGRKMFARLNERPSMPTLVRRGN